MQIRTILDLLESISSPMIIDIDDEDNRGNATGYIIDSDKEQLPNWLEKYGIYDSNLTDNIREEYTTIAFLNNINVYDDYQGQGIGSNLLEEFLSEAINRGAEAIVLVADINESQQDGFDLVGWYSNNGFEKIVDTPSGPVMLLKAENFS